MEKFFRRKFNRTKREKNIQNPDLEVDKDINNEKKENKSGWKEKKEAMYQKIDDKIDFILDLEKFAEENKSLSVNELNEKCQKKFDEVSTHFGKDAIRKYLELSFLQEKNQEAEDRRKKFIFDIMKSLDNGESSKKTLEAEEQEFLRLQEEALSCLRELRVFQKKNLDASFLNQVNGFLLNITYKKYQTSELKDEYEKDPTELIKSIRKKFPFTENYFKSLENCNFEVIFGDYSVNLVLNSEDAKKVLGENRTGGHIPRTNITIVKDREDEKSKQLTIRHENNHNLTDFISNPTFYSDKLYDELVYALKTQFKELTKESNLADKEESENSLKEFKYFTTYILPKYFDENDDEIIADLEEIRKGKISTYLANFLNSIDVLYEVADKIENSEAKEMFLGGMMKMQKEFINYLVKLSQLLFITRRENDEEKLKGALILFKPHQINRIIKYFKKRYGEDKYDFYTQLRPLIKGKPHFKELAEINSDLFSDEKLATAGPDYLDSLSDQVWLIKTYVEKDSPEAFFETANLRKIVNILQKGKIKISDEEKDKVVEILGQSEINSLAFDFSETRDFDQFLEKTKLIKEIGKELEIKEFNQIPTRTAKGLIYIHIEEMVQEDDFELLEKIYKHFPETEFLILHFITGKKVIDWYKKYHNLDYTANDLENDSNLAKFLKKSGLDKKIDDFEKRYK